jgi:hypothetical protein
MSTEQIDPNNTGTVDETDQKALTSQGQAEPAVTANSEQAPSEPDVRESLIKQLMQSPVEEQTEETAEAEEPEAVEESDPIEESETDSKTTEPEAKPEDKPLDAVDTDKRLSERTRKRIEELRGKAAFGDLITKTLVDAKITPDEFSHWTNLSARLKKGDPTAVQELVATAKAFGYTEPTVAKQPEKNVEDIASEIYKAEFEAEVNELNISETLARKQASKLAEARVKAVKAESRVEQEQPLQRTQETQQPINPIRQHALQTIDSLEKDYKSKIANYEKIEKKVAERLVSEYGKQDPITWVGGFENIVRDELRKAATPVQQKAPVKAVAGTQIRPKTEVTLSLNTVEDPRQALVKQLVRGDFTRR